jgi:glycosyltransferase involved in cell wall biosynthesis
LTALADNDHEIGFLRFERGQRQLEDRPLPPAVRQIDWAGGQSVFQCRDGLRLLFSLRQVLRSFNPDLVQAGPIQRTAFLVALTGFHPLVTMSWGYDLLIDAPKGPVWKWATGYTLKRSDAFLGDCDVIRSLAIDYGMKAERIVTFPWGVNLEKFAPAVEKTTMPIRQRFGWDNNIFVILSTRSWSGIYGVEDLANAFVAAANKQRNLRLLMLGNGPLAPKIRKIFQQGAVGELVHFPGQVPQAKLADYYRAADLYVSTSHSDGTSISLLEALACGTPVLVTDIPGNKEWITHPGEAGWLFRDGDAEHLTQGILNAYDNRQHLPAMGQAARKLAVSRANWLENFPNVFKAYALALQGFHSSI